MASSAGRVLVYGGKGALGSKLVDLFKAQNWWVGSLDLVPNEEAHANFVVQRDLSWTEQEAAVEKDVEESLKDEKVDAILCVAGGWAGGNAANKAMIKNADAMWKQSVWPSTISARLAHKFLREGGTLVLPGAQPAIKGTPGMIGYGMAKAAVHQLVKSLAEDKSGMPASSFVAAILPITLDTPMNRKFMPNADHTAWTKLETVAELLLKWSRNEERPANGSLVQLITKEGVTEYIPA